MRIQLGWCLTGGILLGGLVWLAGGCDEKPTEPTDSEPKDYVFYWSRNGVDSIFFGYHVLTGTLDSFCVPGPVLHDLNVSADGQRVYISYADRTKVVRAQDFTEICELPYSGWNGVAVSPNNYHIAVQSGNLRILSTRDYSVVYEDTVAVRDAVFSANGRRLYAPGPSDSCRSIYRLDLAAGFKSTVICIPYSEPVYSVIPSRDEKLMLILRMLGNCNMYIEVFDVPGDSDVFTDLVAPGCGDMVASPDNKYVFFTGPGDLHNWPPTAYSFARYSIPGKYVDSFIVFGTCAPGGLHGVMGSDLALTPDGRYLAIADKNPHGWVLIYDLVLGDTTACVSRPNMECWYLSCQNGR